MLAFWIKRHNEWRGPAASVERNPRKGVKGALRLKGLRGTVVPHMGFQETDNLGVSLIGSGGVAWGGKKKLMENKALAGQKGVTANLPPHRGEKGVGKKQKIAAELFGVGPLERGKGACWDIVVCTLHMT